MKYVGNKCSGYIVSTEMLLIATVLVLGMIVGLVLVRNAILAPDSMQGDDTVPEWSYVASPVNENGLGVTLDPPAAPFTPAVSDDEYTPFTFTESSLWERGVDAPGPPAGEPRAFPPN